MTLTARCPDCSTRFRLEPQQLRMAGGWVRCGQCQRVFDAASQFSELSTPSAAAPLLRRASSDPVIAPRTVPQPLVHTGPERRRQPQRQRAPSAPPAPTMAGGGTEVPTLSFMRDAGAAGQHLRAAGGRARWPLRLTSLLLAALLLLQIVLQQRDALAAQAPALRPLLHGLCAALRCTIEPPRQIDALSISNSSLSKSGATGYRLSLSIKNQSGVALAMPGVELTLLDSAERVVLRRVLVSTDLGAAGSIEPHAEWTGALPFELPGRSERITGYRVLAFYP